jgi:branched-subunit amino acid aminotransferase/4-amino-4-deoxychorismate lyase
MELTFDSDALKGLALSHYGHFTTMHVDVGRVRGLRLHVQRLAQDYPPLFAADVDPPRLRTFIRQSVKQLGDTGLLRITFFTPGLSDDRPQRRRRCQHTRQSARRPRVTCPRCTCDPSRTAGSDPVKYMGLFGALHHRRAAQPEGSGGVVLTGAAGEVTEGSTRDLGLVDGDRVAWQAGPALPGVTMALLHRRTCGTAWPA